jgi:pimeloyl-ACP methyl ester carboxylesterase
VQVHRRLVIHVQGYDARSLAENFDRFQREYARACELYGLSGEVRAAVEARDGMSGMWDVATRGEGWQVETRYRLLRWDDLVRNDLARAPWWKIVQMYRTTGIALLNGSFGRMLRMNWRFALIAFAPILLITVWLLLGSFVGILCMNLVAALGAPLLVAKIVGGVTGVGGFASVLWLSEPITGLLQRCDEAASIDEFVNGKRKDWSERLDAFAGDVADAVHESQADEVVIVGHGFGAALAINGLGRALARDGTLGHSGPRVALLTLGACLPVVSFNPEAKGFRNRLRQLATATGIGWIDVQSRDDILSFCPFDPIAGNDIVLGAERRNPQVLTVRFRDLWATGSSGLRRLRVSKLHDQLLLANERAGAAYDYTLICCGPLDLVTRATRPQQAVAAMAGKFEPDPAAGR